MGPLLVDADWYAFCQSLYKGIDGDCWEEMYFSYREMSRAVGVKKPQEAQKAKALWKMKVAKDAGEEWTPRVKTNIRGRNETRLALWEEHLKDPIVGLDKTLLCVEVIGSSLLLNRGCDDLRPCRFVSGSRVVGQTSVGKGLAFSGRVGQCAATHSFHAVEHPGEVWAAWRAFLLFDSEEAGFCARQRGLQLFHRGVALESQS